MQELQTMVSENDEYQELIANRCDELVAERLRPSLEALLNKLSALSASNSSGDSSRLGSMRQQVNEVKQVCELRKTAS